LEDTVRSLKEEIRSCKADNDIIMQAHEKQEEVNVVILQSCQHCNDRDPFRSSMRRRKKIMGHMETSLMVVTGWIKMTQLEMEIFWIFWIGKVIDTNTILVLVLTCMMIVIVIILRREVIGVFSR